MHKIREYIEVAVVALALMPLNHFVKKMGKNRILINQLTKINKPRK